MLDENDILWGMYQENCVQGRHHESQRAMVTNLVIVISAGVLGLVTYKELSYTYLPLTVFLAALGIFGAIFSAKHYERFRIHMARAKEYRNKLDELLLQKQIKALKKIADDKHKKKFPYLYELKLNKFWITLHIFVSILGLTLSVLILSAPN